MAELRPRLARLRRLLDAHRREARDCPGCNGPLLILDEADGDCQGLCGNCGFVCGPVHPATVIRRVAELIGSEVGLDAMPDDVERVRIEAERTALSMIARHHRT